jgi:hypothetical protein
MAGLQIADRVKETTTTTGTGTIDLAGAATGYRSFVSAIGDGNECFYVIVQQNQSEWEVGIGTVTDASPDTLSRDTVLASSNSGSLVNFSAGTKDVFVSIPADVLAADRTIIIETAAITLDNTHHNKTITNTGASGAVSGREIELPPTPFVGMKINFYNNAVDGMRIRANTGQIIRIGTIESSSAGYIDSTALGQYLTLVALTTTLWVCFEPIQSWSVN